MYKKSLFLFSIVIFLLCGFCISSFSTYASDMKALKIEQSRHEYGTLQKKFKNPQFNKEENFSSVINTEEKRKEPSIFRIFNSLIFVIFLILLTGWIYMKMKKINPEQLLSGKFNKLNENNFKIISSMQLGAGKAIYLIEINNKQLIIGTTASSVNLLAKMDKVETQNEIPKECIEKLFDNNLEDID